MTAAIAVMLLVLAVLDGSFAGFRASVGRNGLINHRQSDRQAARRGAGLVCVLLVPAIAAARADLVVHPAHLGLYARAGKAMLEIYGPYALLVLIALACYTALNWRYKYLASALILGPFTLIRPVIVILGGTVGAAMSSDAAVATAAGLSVIAVLAVEPIASRLWYTRALRGVPADRRTR